MARQRLTISILAPTELSRLCSVPVVEYSWVDGVLLAAPVNNFLLHSLLLVSDHVKMVKEEWLYHGAFESDPKERIVFYVLQIWLL